MRMEHLGEKLKRLKAVFLQAGDESNARKTQQLIEKLENRTFIVAFCGHFSAGKSSMINRLMGSDVLPSSPIPTSANVVTVEKGPSNARVWRRDGSFFDVPLAGLEQLREYAVDGEEIETIRIQHPTGFLPDGVQVMDTPGIDSTDDAHKVATESALHLADLVLYVMDYNHVQSEVNFGFTKTLKDRGKAVWLVVNQVDKHNEFELPFAEYSRSVKESFAAWGIEPDGIFFTSLRENGHERNQFAAMEHALRNLLLHREALLGQSVLQSALQLVEEHVRLEAAKKDSERRACLEILAEAGALPARETDGEDSLSTSAANLAEVCRERLRELQRETAQSESSAARLKEELERELQSLIENATLTPFQTTELGGRYLESRRPGFRVGLLFAGSKTEQERGRRLTELHADFAGKVSANLDWHFKDLLVRIPERYGIRSEEYANAVYGLKLEITPQMLAGWVKEGALAAPEYMYQYAKDISAEVKSMYRRAAAEFVEHAVRLAESAGAKAAGELKEELEKTDRLLQAAEALERLEQREAAYRMELVGIFQEERQATAGLAGLYAVNQPGVPVDGFGGAGNRAGVAAESAMPEAGAGKEDKKGAGETAAVALLDRQPLPAALTERTEAERNTARLQAEGEARQRTGKNYKDALVNAAVKLRQSAGQIANIPGMHTFAAHMTARAERLEQNLFTVALFGAFSAGKSSFANAMMGNLVLPVSPNPTTATINKILPPSPEWPHGSVRVKIKSAADIVADVKGSLAIFGHQAGGPAAGSGGGETGLREFFDEALRLISSLHPEEVPPNAKPHFSFLKAVEKGWADMRGRFGEELRVDPDVFREYVAREEKACFVEWIELYYDCRLTRQGIMLIDTPGADSINARHTRVAFDYIKNADAVLFVTYYNHAFSNADREFLIQLGRVKDSFAMDKMFFLVNAADLADDEEELAGVVSHIRKNLIACGISAPRIYPVSSQMALLARLSEKDALPASAERVYRKLTGVPEEAALPDPGEAVKRSGIGRFEEDFISFTIEELTEVAVQAAAAEIRRALIHLRELIDSAKTGETVRDEKKAALNEALQRVHSGIGAVETDSETRSLEKEIDELVYYVKQRVFLRFNDAFNEFFNSSVLRDDARDIKKVLTNCLQELIRFLTFDLAQELRATAVRVENQVNRGAGRIFEKLAATVANHLPGCQLEPYEKASFPTPEFPEELAGAGMERFSAALAIYKNAKDFFERNAKGRMRDEVEKLLQEPVAAYLTEGSRILKTRYAEALQAVVRQVRQDVISQTNEYADGLLAALSMNVDIGALERAAGRIQQLLQEQE